VEATKLEDYGDYFAWGETSTKDSYVKNNGITYGIPYSDMKADGISSSDSGDLTDDYDAATANWGRGWHIPLVG